MVFIAHASHHHAPASSCPCSTSGYLKLALDYLRLCSTSAAGNACTRRHQTGLCPTESQVTPLTITFPFLVEGSGVKGPHLSDALQQSISLALVSSLTHLFLEAPMRTPLVRRPPRPHQVAVESTSADLTGLVLPLCALDPAKTTAELNGNLTMSASLLCTFNSVFVL